MPTCSASPSTAGLITAATAAPAEIVTRLKGLVKGAAALYLATDDEGYGFIEGDGNAKYAYAGDLLGNIWRFDLEAKEWIMEGYGVDPDIVVDNDPAREFAGTDDQLLRAIDEIKKAMAERQH